MIRRVALCALALAACNTPEMSPPGDTPEERCAAWTDAGPAIALERASLEATLGAPDSLASTVEPNRHIPDATDVIHILTWPGISITVRTPPDGRELVEDVVIRDDRFLRWPDPGIGDHANAVMTLLGEPAEHDATHLLYFCGAGPVNEPVAFELRNDSVAAIVFHFYVD